MIAIIQVSIELEEDFTRDQLRMIEGKMKELCAEIEREGTRDFYIRAQFSVNGKVWNAEA